MATVLSTSKDCRNAYREILLGYTHAEEDDFYIKHFREADLGFIESTYAKCTKEAESEGLSFKRDKLEFLKAEGHWTDEEEHEFIVQNLATKDAKDHYSKITHKEQREAFRSVVEEQETKLNKIKSQRDEIIEPTVEGYCEKRLNEFYVYHAVYKDPELKEHFFTKDEFDELSFLELHDLVKKYNNETSKFSEKNIKIIGVNHFFLNAFFMSDDDPVKFYGKNVLELSMYQMNLFSRGKFYKSVLVEGKDPPEQYYEVDHPNGLEELAKWYEIQGAHIRQSREAQAGKARTRNVTKASGRRRR
jgi:hypothetical protein